MKVHILATSIIFFSFMAASVGKMNYSIDWSKGVFHATGHARIETTSSGQPLDPETKRIISLNQSRFYAYKYAREEARENMAKALRNLQLDGDRKLIDAIRTNGEMQERITTLLEEKLKFKEIPQDFSTAQCNAKLTLGDIISYLPVKYYKEEFPIFDNTEMSTKYTSLVIDTRGLNIVPMVYPSIYNEDGREVYSRNHVDIRIAANSSIVTYEYDEHYALRNKRAGKHPYYTVALKNVKGSPVLSQRDIERIFAHSKTRNSLKKCNVIFIIDRKEK